MLASLDERAQAATIRASTRAAAVDCIEDRLALGLECVDVPNATLLGVCCRALGAYEIPPQAAGAGPGDVSAEATRWFEDVDPELAAMVDASRANGGRRADDPEPMPPVLRDVTGTLFVPIPQEYTRLEGHRWATSRVLGRGSLFVVQQFGTRGECVLCPPFCMLDGPLSSAFIEGRDGKRLPSSWLSTGIRKLSARVRKAHKLPLRDLMDVMRDSPSISLVVPAGILTFKEDPKSRDFSLKSARRYPFYVDKVEMGARLNITFVPQASTHSGDLDKRDAEHLYSTVGAQLFEIAGERGRLCVWHEGGPPLDAARLAGAELEDACTYLAKGWAHTLGASPETWTRLSVSLGSAEVMEASMGPAPGKGHFVPPRADHILPSACFYCEASPCVGVEVPRPGDAWSDLGLCILCSGFVAGSPAYKRKQALAQYITRPHDQMVGTTDERLDETLFDRTYNLTPVSSLNSHKETAGDSTNDPLRLSKLMASVSSTAETDTVGWYDDVVPQDAFILAVGGLIKLESLPPHFEFDEAETLKSLRGEVSMQLSCDLEEVAIPCLFPEPKLAGLWFGFVLLHPSLVNGSAGSPTVPLDRYRALLQYLREPSGERPPSSPAGDRPSSRRRPHLLPPHTTMRLGMPCCMIFCETLDQVDLQELSMDGLSASYSVASAAEADDKVDDFKSSFKSQLSALIGTAQQRLDEGASEYRKAKSAAVEKPHTRRTLLRASLSLQPMQASEMLNSIRHSKSLTGHGLEVTKAPIMEAAPTVPKKTIFDLAIAAFQPSPEQLALRLRELAASGEAVRGDQLLARWGDHPDPDYKDHPMAAFAVASRAAESFRGQSALDIAIAAGDHATVLALAEHLPEVPPEGTLSDGLSAQKSLLNSPNPVTGYTPLYGLVLHTSDVDRTAKLVSLLLARHVDLNLAEFAPNGREAEPVLAAVVRRGERELAKALVELHADVNLRAAGGCTILQVGIERGELGVVEVLLAAPTCMVDAVDDRGRTALVTALRLGSPDFVRMLLDAECRVDMLDFSGIAPILHGTNLRDSCLFELILARRADANATDPSDGNRVLHLAAMARNGSLVDALLAARADLSERQPRDGRAPLHLAAGLRMPAFARELLDLRAEVDPCSIVGDTPLRLAVQNRDLEIAQILCEAKADPNLANRSGCAPIHLAAAQGGERMTELLAQYGANLNLADSRRWRPIHYGAASGQEGVLRMLVEAKADPMALSFHGRSPRELAKIAAPPPAGKTSARSAGEDYLARRVAAARRAAMKRGESVPPLGPSPGVVPRFEIIFDARATPSREAASLAAAAALVSDAGLGASAAATPSAAAAAVGRSSMPGKGAQGRGAAASGPERETKHSSSASSAMTEIFYGISAASSLMESSAASGSTTGNVSVVGPVQSPASAACRPAGGGGGSRAPPVHLEGIGLLPPLVLPPEVAQGGSGPYKLARPSPRHRPVSGRGQPPKNVGSMYSSAGASPRSVA